jgi:hypothetical protein
MSRSDWTLDNAIASWGCPVCILVRQDTFNYLAKQVYAWSTGETAGLELLAQGGFCTQHAANVLDMASGVGVASIYDRFLREAQAVLGEWSKLAERGPVPSPNSRLLHPDCPVCAVRRESEGRRITELLGRLEEVGFKRRYESSRGLCLPHMRLALEKAESAEMRAFLLAVQIAQVERLQADLALSKRKRQAVPQEVMTPRERTAWLTVVEKFAGKSC